MAEIFRITKIEELQHRGLWAFIREAMSTNRLIVDLDAALEELVASILYPQVALFVTHDGQDWSGLSYMQINASAFNKAGVVIHFYSNGNAPSRRALLTEMVAFTRAAGFTRIIGMDTNDSPDAFCRLFKVIGKPIKSGIVVIFDTTESLV